MKKNNVIDLSVAALCVALGILIPSVFHLFGQAGAVFCPMHIPVIVCGIVCGWEVRRALRAHRASPLLSHHRYAAHLPHGGFNDAGAVRLRRFGRTPLQAL